MAEMEGYRAEIDKKYKLLDRGVSSDGDPDGFLANFLRRKGSDIPISIMDEGYQIVPNGRFTSWTIGGGAIYNTPVVKGEYRDGLKQGQWDFWHTGELAGIAPKKAAEGEYINGLQEGHWKYYGTECRDMVIMECDYVKGAEQEGTIIEYEYVMDHGKCVPGKVSHDVDRLLK